MDCELIDSRMSRRSAGYALSEAASEHLGKCSRCRTLYAWVFSKSATAGPSSGVQQQILHDLTASLKPVTPLPSVPAMIGGFAAVFVALALALIAMTDKAGLRAMTPAQLVSVTGVLAAGATLVCVFLVWQMIPGSPRLISVRAAAPLAAGTLVLVLALLFPWRISPEFLSEGWPCALMGLAIAAAVAALLLPLVLRGTATSRTASGAALGGFAGTLAVTVLQFQCMRQQAPHLLLWHMGSLAVAILVGALMGRAIGWMIPAPRHSG